jgi:hypothetical protein
MSDALTVFGLVFRRVSPAWRWRWLWLVEDAILGWVAYADYRYTLLPHLLDSDAFRTRGSFDRTDMFASGAGATPELALETLGVMLGAQASRASECAGVLRALMLGDTLRIEPEVQT